MVRLFNISSSFVLAKQEIEFDEFDNNEQQEVRGGGGGNDGDTEERSGGLGEEEEEVFLDSIVLKEKRSVYTFQEGSRREILRG